jgi:hypothetical protein
MLRSRLRVRGWRRLQCGIESTSGSDYTVESMRILSRMIAGFTFLTVIGTLIRVIQIWHWGGMSSLAHSGSVGALTIAGWLITLVAGPLQSFFCGSKMMLGVSLRLSFGRAFASITYSAWSCIGTPPCSMDE